MSYRPDQRQVRSQIMTQAGWLQGTLHVPRASRLVLHLGAQPEFLRVTEVSFMAKQQQVPFISLQRSRVILIVPEDGEADPGLETEQLVPRRIFVLLEGGMLAGTLGLRQGVRTSDFFSKQHGFVLLHDCVLRLGGLNEEIFVEERHPQVIINAAQVIAVSESELVDASSGAPWGP